MAIILNSLAALQSQVDVLLAGVMVLVVLMTVTPLVGRLASPRGSPGFFKGHPGHNSPTFGRYRNDYLRQGKEQSPDKQFSFWHGPHHMVSVSGEVARTVLLTSRKLNALAGFATLFGSFLKIDSLTNSYARLALLTFKRCAQDEHISSNLPRLINDSRIFLDTIEPFEAWEPTDKLGYLMYQLTHRMIGTHDIANNPELVVTTRDIYKPLDHSSPLEIWFPLLPTISKLRKAWAYTRLHWLIQGFITDRRKTGRREKDAMQMMMDQEFKVAVITLSIIGAMLAGVLNTSITAAWNLCYLAQNPLWQSKLRAEVDQVILKYRCSPGEGVAEVLQRLELNDWEREFPLFELILKETMRFTMAGQIVRKNISNKGVPVGDTQFIIPQNSFAVYSVEDVHMNPSVYENPLQWDPSRHDKDRAEGSQSPHSFLAWGSGNHVCPAMRFSKLNILVPTVMLVALYDFEMCNAQGQICNEPLPSLSFDGIGAGRPTGKVYVKCSPRVKQDA